MSGQRQSVSRYSSTNSTTSERSKSEDPSSYPCSCGMGDGSGNYIQCDNENCLVGWHHWECMQVTEAPAGTWLCPSCSPSAAFYIKQLVTKRAASPVGPEVEMTDEAASSNTRKQKPVFDVKEKDVPKKGVAVKKDGEKKPKPKWIGWVELSSDGEQEFKQKVDAQWDVEDDIVGRRRRSSRAIVKETELNPRALRARSRPEQQVKKRAFEEHEEEGDDEGEDREAESDVSIYEEKEDTSVDTSAESAESEASPYKKNPQVSPARRRASRVCISSSESEDSEEAPVRRRLRRRASRVCISSDDSEDSEEAPVRRRAGVIYFSSDESNDSDDTMDVDQEPTGIQTNASDELSDPSSSSEDNTSSHLRQASLASERNHEETPRQSDAADTEDSMDLVYEDAPEYQHEEPQANRSDPSAGSESMDDGQEFQASTTATPIVDNASLQYQVQVNCRG